MPEPVEIVDRERRRGRGNARPRRAGLLTRLRRRLARLLNRGADNLDRRAGRNRARARG